MSHLIIIISSSTVFFIRNINAYNQCINALIVCITILCITGIASYFGYNDGLILKNQLNLEEHFYRGCQKEEHRRLDRSMEWCNGKHRHHKENIEKLKNSNSQTAILKRH